MIITIANIMSGVFGMIGMANIVGFFNVISYLGLLTIVLWAYIRFSGGMVYVGMQLDAISEGIWNRVSFFKTIFI